MTDKEMLQFLRGKSIDDLLEVLATREFCVLFCTDTAPGQNAAFITKSERLIALIKTEMARRGAFDDARVVSILNSHGVKLWRPFTEDDEQWFKELAQDLEELADEDEPA